MSSKELSIIIVTYNSEKHIIRCIDSILKSKINSKKTNLIIVDNNSSDKTKNLVNQKYNGKVLLITNRKNLGFAKAVNIGIKCTNNNDILLINPDTRCESDSIQKLISEKEKHAVDICGGKMLKNNKERHNSFVREPNIMTGLFDFTNLKKIFPNNRWHKHFYYLDSKISNQSPREVDVVSGGFMYIDRSVINKIGLFDERYFMYLEDVDYCTRAKKHGFKVFYFPSSTIWHEGGGSSENVDKINYPAWVKSRNIYFQKNLSITENVILQPSFFIDRFFVSILRIIKSKQ